jgi:PAS domain S-box-containing protein
LFLLGVTRKLSSNLKYWFLGGGFGLIISLMVLFGFFALQQVDALAELTGKLYRHPLTVSNAVLEANSEITAMHRDMKDVVLARSDEDLELAITKVDASEKRVYQHFDIILDRFLGDKSRITETRNAFSDWKVIRSEIIELTRAREYEQAAGITKGKGANHVDLLNRKMGGLIDFARNKAAEFLKDSERQEQEIRNFLYRMLSFLVLISSAVGIMVWAAFLRFERLQSRSEEELQQSHDELEQHVKERTEELTNKVEELDFQKFALDEHAIVSIADVKGNITYVNNKFCEISEYSREELIGKNHRIVKSEEHPPELYADLWKTIANGNTWRGEIRNDKKGGGYYWVQTTIVPTLNEDRKPFQYISIRTDITEQKQTEHMLLEAKEALEINVTDLADSQQRVEGAAAQHIALSEDLALARDQAEAATLAKSEFLASMSHEIRTPMAGVIGMADLVIDTDLSPQQLDWMTSIKTSGENLLMILNEILDQSKLEAGKLEISPIDFHLASFVKDTTHLFVPKIDDKGLALEIDLEKNLPESAHADRMRIGQILTNLLSNALKFTDTGSITVHVEHEPQNDGNFLLRFNVTDSGIGLSKNAQGKLFSAFSQADSSTSRTYGGTGLGLSISKQLAELMGGEIGVESTEGKGSTFWFTIFCQPTKSKIKAPDKRRSLDRWVASRPLKVVVADDNIVNQQLIQAILVKLNHHVTIANNGKVVTELVEAEDFDLILMDIRMPVMDGIEATSVIRSMDTDKSKIPIIALTADIAAGNIQEYTDIGIDEVCAKPLDLPVVLKAIDRQLGEEIHRSIPNARPARQDKPDTDTNENESADVKSFSQVLERVSNIADQKTNMEEDDEDSFSTIATLGAEKFAELLEMYESGLRDQCNALRAELETLMKDLSDDSQKTKVKELTHMLKGGGGIFGYHLVTTIAGDADDLLLEKDTLDTTDLQVIANHSDALSLISDKKLSGNGGKAGRILLQGLKDFS